jgi:hypothetical protein
MAQQFPSSNLFVVRPLDNQKSAVADNLESVGTVEELGSEELLLLQTRQTPANAEAAWRDVREALNETGNVQPVLLDETGESHYPTGEVTVRFHKAQTDEELQRFASKNNLRLRHRNQFMPQQIVFDVVDANERYLPKIVEEVAEQDEVKNAWANTLSRYKRISQA